MNEDELRLHARLTAIEFMLLEAFAILYGAGENTPEDLEKNLRQYLPTLTFPGIAPEQSDQLAAEIEEAVATLLRAVVVRSRGPG